MVLRDIALGVTRFDAIQRNLGVSRKVLTQRLASLLEHGVVQRTAYQDNPDRYDYTLTEKGNDLARVLVVMQAFGDKWAPLDAGPPLEWRHLTCGALATPELCCSGCGKPMTAADVLPEKGPGYQDAAFPEITKVLDLLANQA